MNNIINLKEVDIERYVLALIERLNEYTDEYNKGQPLISDTEWDELYFELICCEHEMGKAFSHSPTQTIHYTVVNELKKIEHNHKMLSLDKTKDINEVIDFLDNHETIAMCKMDGLTCSLRYVNGRLVGAETRGNGFIGEDILHNVKIMPTVPQTIPYKDELIVDGEIICQTDMFNMMFANEYKNIRNFAAGSIRLLNSHECARRQLMFVAWDVIKGLDEMTYLSEKLNKIQYYGFNITPYLTLPYSQGWEYINMNINLLAQYAEENYYPIDGIVFKFNNIAYGASLGETAHHFKNAIAYKFFDDEYETELIDIDWTMGRTGVLTPVAEFKPVEIDGTEVSRASLHNISIMEELLGDQAHKYQKIKVFKSNMIIPQIASADKEKHGILYFYEHPMFDIPEICPICGKALVIKDNDGVKTLNCINPDCDGKLINKLDHFCGKKGLDIKGLSKATLEKLMDWGWVNNIVDIMTLKNYRMEWIKKPGFGPKSVDKILEAIEMSKNTTLEAFISSIGIPLIGKTMAKDLVKHISTYEEFRQKADNYFDFSVFDGFAESKTSAIWNFDYEDADKVYSYLNIQTKEKNNNSSTCEGLTVVITGSLIHFKNRNELKSKIEACGGKVVDSVSSKTSCVICNDSSSKTAKINTAKKLFIPIMSEKTFMEKYLTF